MNNLNIQQIRQLTNLELANQILELRKSLFDLRFKQATKKTIKTHLFKQYRKKLAQLLTIQTELKT